MSAATAISRPSEAPEKVREPVKPLNLRRETIYTWVGLIFTLAASIMVERDISPIIRDRIATGAGIKVVDDVALMMIVYYLIFGTLLYFVCRLGYLKRVAAHRPARREDLDAFYGLAAAPVLDILVPSYREEERVVHQTLLSAALMEYPDRRIVLLIDDPPDTRDPEAMMALARMRRLPGKVQKLLEIQKQKYAAELAAFERRVAQGRLDFQRECHRLAKLHRAVARWLDEQSETVELRDHSDKLFVERILREPARVHRAHAEELEVCAANDPGFETRLEREYRRLALIFGARLSSFERKRFANLSHASNKAMNLNSYLGLMGGSFREVIRPQGLFLEECDPAVAQLRVRRPAYVITLDADSLLLSDYAMRLVHTMEQPQGAQYAVVQTPYTAVPGSSSILERTAGAQTDLQWLMGQGSTQFGATFWVGASALLRRKALEDICQIDYEGGHPIKKYIRDRTLVEDSESSIDLIASGWKLYNYPDRLCYSATPPDFGSLVIQRRRWANGGLLILPKLLRYLLVTPGRIKRLPEALVRFQYLFSTAAVNLAMLSLLVIPFEKKMPCFWLVLTPIAYYLLYGRDLVSNNHSWRDLPRVYALNLLLIPVNLGGVAKSVEQWWTGRQTPFVRTPKVSGRTAAPALYIVLTWAIIWYACVEALIDLRDGKYLHGWFALLNAVIFGYALVRFVGIMRAAEDVLANFKLRVRSAWAQRRPERGRARRAQIARSPN